jgi:hypothetical protein
MLRLILNQLALYRRAAGNFIRLLESSLRIAHRDFRLWRIRRKAYRNLINQALKKEEFIRELEESPFSQDDIKISYIASIRYIDNANSRLPKFLDSILANADDLKRIEVLMVIDSDDDIEYFLLLKRIYGNRFRICVFVSPERYGYERLHMYDKLLFKKVAPKTLMICDYSDDVTITYKGFDTKLLEIDSWFPDKIYFVHTRHSWRAAFLGDVSKEVYRLYWVMQVQGPYSYVPVISRKIYELAEQALQTLPEAERGNWSPFCNASIYDCYIDAIASMMVGKLRDGWERIIPLDMMKVHHYNLYAAHQHRRDRYNLSPTDRAIIDMLGTSTLKHLDTIATYLARAATAAPLIPSKDTEDDTNKPARQKLAS